MRSEEEVDNFRSISSDGKSATQAVRHVMEAFQADRMAVLHEAVREAGTGSENDADHSQSAPPGRRGAGRNASSGAAMLLRRTSHERYGERSDAVKAQDLAATPDPLKAWAVAIFEAGSAGELLWNGPPNQSPLPDSARLRHLRLNLPMRTARLPAVVVRGDPNLPCP